MHNQFHGSLVYTDSGFAQIVEAIARKHGYQDTILNAPNPQTKEEFVQQLIDSMIEGMYASAIEIEMMSKAMRDVAQARADGVRKNFLKS